MHRFAQFSQYVFIQRVPLIGALLLIGLGIAGLFGLENLRLQFATSSSSRPGRT